MGNFYVNFSVKSTDTDKIATALEEDGQLCFITPPTGSYTVVFDRETDGRDDQIILTVGRLLCQAMGVVVLAIFNHDDDDVLMYWLFENSNLTAAAMYFEGDELRFDDYDLANYSDAKPVTPEHLCAVLGVPDAIDTVRNILDPNNNYVFASHRHAALVEALQLPLWSVGHGFKYIEQGELPSGLKLSDLRRVG